MFSVIAIATAVFIATGAALSTVFVVSGKARYELTVELEFQGDRYSGVTVWESSLTATPDMLPGVPPKVTTAGDAIDIRLSDGKTLFILRRSNAWFTSDAYGYEYWSCPPGKDLQAKVAALQTFTEACDLKLQPHVVVVDKNGGLDTIVYGPGVVDPRVRIISTIAIATSKPVSSGIAQRHPWILRLPHAGSSPSSQVFYFEDFTK